MWAELICLQDIKMQNVAELLQVFTSPLLSHFFPFCTVPALIIIIAALWAKLPSCSHTSVINKWKHILCECSFPGAAAAAAAARAPDLKPRQWRKADL